jgi:hypothetical protein
VSRIALKMLTGDRAKYLGLVFGITFATLLMSQQVSIFIGLMTRTASQIVDVREADVWAVPLFKGNAVARSPAGSRTRRACGPSPGGSSSGAP